MTGYCSEQQARDAGATGNAASVLAAIDAASLRVERYTGDVFAPVAMTLQLPVGRDGTVRPGKRIVSVDSVTWLGTASPLVPSSYSVSSSATRGARDQIALVGALGWADVTVLGAEPWNDGWAGLSSRFGYSDPQVVVVGTFGWATVPFDVAAATALIAATIRAADDTPDVDAPAASSKSVDSEGNVLPVVPPFDDGKQQQTAQLLARVRSRTTGSIEADALLASYVREPVRIR